MVKLWNVGGGKEIRTLMGSFVVFSPDAKILASVEYDKNIIKLWNAESGREIRTLSGNSVIFSPNGKIFASVTDSATRNGNIIKLWDTESGKDLKSFSGNLIAFNPDGKTFASVENDDKTIKLRNIESENESRSLSGHSESINSVAFSADGSTLVSVASTTVLGRENKIIKLWDMDSGNELKTLSKATDSIGLVSFSPEGRIFASVKYDSADIKLRDMKSGEVLKSLSGNSGPVRSVIFSRDGTIIASIGRNNQKVTLWDVESGKEQRALSGEFNSIGLLTFSPDGKTLASIANGKTIVLWNVESGKETQILSGHSDFVTTIAFSPDGKTLASGSNDKTVRFLDVRRGKSNKSFSDGYEPVKLVSFSDDGESFLRIGSWSKRTDVFDLKANTLIRSYSGEGFGPHTGIAKSFPSIYKNYYGAAVTDKFFAEPIENNKIGLIKKEPFKMLATLIALDENDWTVVAVDNRFDASSGAQKLMHFVVGLEPLDLEQIKDRYYTPNLLQRIFKGENLDATRKVSVFTSDELYPLAEYAPLKANDTVVNVKLKNRGGGIGRVQVYVNGAEFLSDARPENFDPKSATSELTIDFSAAKTLKRGEANEIQIIARNGAGWLRSRGAKIVYTDKGKKDDTPQELYAIVAGVSDYESATLDLQYSSKDARDFAKAVEMGGVKLFGVDRVHVRLLDSDLGRTDVQFAAKDSARLDPTKENFQKVFEEFKKAKPNDVLVVYLAGHGTSINRGGDIGDTYLYLTKEAVTTDKTRLLDDKLRAATTISSEELTDWIRDIPALKRAMILDTCAAGAVEASLVKPRDLSPDQIKALDRMKDRTGFYVLMGSAADAQSYEATRYGQGLLTYSLLQGMSGARLRNGEYADVSLLFAYAEDMVVQMAKGIGGIQQPRIIAPTESRSFDIGQFSSTEKARFTLAKIKPLILQPQFINEKRKFDDLKLSRMVAKALRDESSSLARGDSEPRLVFVDGDEMADAISPSGVYEVNGDHIKVTLILVKNDKPIKTVIVEGSVSEREALAMKIVAATVSN
jgi:WD40 repeat protein/uncharacterized caspase-like protein